MATVTDTTTDVNGNVIIDVSSSADDSITLATAGNYSDKNIIFNLAIQKGAVEPVLQEKNVIPSTVAQEVIPDDGYDGLSKVSVSGDVNLVAGNIKSGVSIFSVNGEYEGSIVKSTFTLDSKTYEFNVGMTWTEWVKSEYNTFGWVVSDEYVMYQGGTGRYYICYPNGSSNTIYLKLIKKYEFVTNVTYSYMRRAGGGGADD